MILYLPEDSISDGISPDDVAFSESIELSAFSTITSGVVFSEFLEEK